MKKRDRKPPDEAPLVDAVRQALASGHPLDLLGLASVVIQATKPDALAYLKSRQRATVCLDDLVAGFVGVKIPETTALLAVLAELIVDDENVKSICRQAVTARDDSSPGWIVELPHVAVYRAVRMTHVLGDGDELLIGARFADGHEFTCVASINHLVMSEVEGAFFVPDSIDAVLAVAVERNADPDTSFVDMSLADARAWIHHGLEQLPWMRDSDSWPGCRPLVQWLIGHLPEGGTTYQRPEWDWDRTSELSDTFFASVPGTPFNEFDHRELLLELLDTGSGHPLRWSAMRVEQALKGPPLYDDRIPVERVLDAPELLRAFIPFAHAQSGIRDELTSQALEAIDQMAPAYHREVLQTAKSWYFDDEAS